MGRPSKPWYWKERDRWMATIRGKRRVLATGERSKDQAHREFHRLMAQAPTPRPVASPRPTVKEILDRFHDYATGAVQATTLELYTRRLKEFSTAYGPMDAASLKPKHVAEWMATRKWSSCTRRTAVIIIKRAFSWATKQGYLDHDPTLVIEKDRETRREAIPTRETVDRFFKAIDSAVFRDFFEAVMLTGCRPGEACKVEAKDFDPKASTWTVEGKTTRKTGRMRIIYLTPRVVEICERLAKEHPTGALFRNHYGNPWNTQSYGQRIRELREKLHIGREVVAYGLRHLWITDALEQSVPIATVAELAGHSNTAMISKNYSHLSERASHLREAARKVRPEG